MLWPNDRGTEATYYYVSVDGYSSFIAGVADGDIPINFFDFKYNGQKILPNEMDLIQKYLDRILPAEKGDKGEQGIQGIQGISGSDGIQGIQGIQGEKGADGSATDLTAINSAITNLQSSDVLINDVAMTTVIARANYRGQVIYNEVFDSVVGLAVTAGTISADAVNYMSGSQGLSLTSGLVANVYQIVTKNGLSLDLTGTSGMIRMFVQQGSGTSVYTGISFVYVTLTDNNNYTRQYRVLSGRYGWTEVDFCLEEAVNDTSPNRSFNNANITKISYGFYITTAGINPVVVFDQLMFYKPRNKLPLIWFRADAGYVRQFKFGAYLKALPMAINSKSSGPVIHIALTGTSGGAGSASSLSSDQLKAMVYAGHYIGIYGQGEDGNMWVNKTDAQKLSNIIKSINNIISNGFPMPKFLAMSGASGWTYSDDTKFLNKYFNIPCGFSDFVGNRYVHPVASKYAYTSNFTSDTAPLLVQTGDINISTGILTMSTVQIWQDNHPVKLSTSGSFPTCSTPLIAGNIYWLAMTTTTGGLLYPTALDSINKTNSLSFTTAGTGVLTVTSVVNKYIGPRVYALLKNNGMWVQGCHCAGDIELINAKFEADALASIVNSGQAQFANIDEIVSGVGII